MEFDPVVEARVEELCGLTMRKFKEVVRREIDGSASTATKKALAHPILSRRWLRAVALERRSIAAQLRTLKRDRSFTDKAALERLDKYILALDEKYAEVEWQEKLNTAEASRQQQGLEKKYVAARQQLEEQHAEAMAKLRADREAVKKKLATLTKLRKSLQGKSDLLKAMGGHLPTTDFKRQALAELARRHPEEFKDVLSELLTNAGVEFAEADVQRSWEKLTK